MGGVLLFDIMVQRGVLISEHGVPLLQGNTVIGHSLRLEDADIPIIAAMKS